MMPPKASMLPGRGRVTTLGMFIIDQFEVRDEGGEAITLDTSSIGGGGIFAMVATRLFLPAGQCGMVVDKGSDFPSHFEQQLQAYGDDMVYFRQRDGLTTRAVNMYSGTKIGEGHQSFRYLSPQLQLTPKDLVAPSCPFARGGILPEYIHVVCTSDRARSIAGEMSQIQQEGHLGLGKGWKAELLWEPLGRSCHPEYLQDVLELVRNFTVFSPNLLELHSLLDTPSEESIAAAEFAAQTLRDLVHEAHGACTVAIVVRAGPLGSYTLSPGWTGWVPAYWTSEEQDKVVDVTGGGNAFMGGLMAGLFSSGDDLRTASIYGAVAASFAIQQRGLPQLFTDTNGVEQWNGDDPWIRVKNLEKRTST